MFGIVFGRDLWGGGGGGMKISQTWFRVEKTAAYGLLIIFLKLLQYTNVKWHVFGAQDNWILIGCEGKLTFIYHEW